MDLDKIRRPKLATMKTVMLALAVGLAVHLIVMTVEYVLSDHPANEKPMSIERQQALEQLRQDMGNIAPKLTIEPDDPNSKSEPDHRYGIETTQPK